MKFPASEIIERLARFAKAGNNALWDFGDTFLTVRDEPDFAYAEAVRSAKDLYGVDLYPGPTATKVTRALEAFRGQGGVPLDELRKYSPYTCYDISRLVEITPANVEHYLQMLRTMTRDEILDALSEDPDAKPQETTTITIDAGVAVMMQQARDVFAQAAGAEKMSATVFVEITSQLILDSTQEALRTIYRRLHGDEDQ